MLAFSSFFQVEQVLVSMILDGQPVTLVDEVIETLGVTGSTQQTVKDALTRLTDALR